MGESINYITLNNGVRMPKLGYGVYQVTREECERCVTAALDKKQSTFFSHTDPAMVEWFVQMLEGRKQQKDSTKETKNW